MVGQTKLFSYLCRAPLIKSFFPPVDGIWEAELNSNWTKIQELQGQSPAHSAKPLMAQVTIKSTLFFVRINLTSADRAALPTDKVLLAHRTENWLKSDPRAMNDWFVQEIEDKGKQFRRVVRYLKAFRDMQWPERGPSSILLMAASALVFEGRHARDDLALVDVLEKLPGVLREGVTSPITMKLP